MPDDRKQDVVFRRIGGRIIPIKRSKFNSHQFSQRRRKVGQAIEGAGDVASVAAVGLGAAFGIMTASGNKYTRALGKFIGRRSKLPKMILSNQRNAGTFLIREAKQLRRIKLIKGLGIKTAAIGAALSVIGIGLAPDVKRDVVEGAFE